MPKPGEDDDIVRPHSAAPPPVSGTTAMSKVMMLLLLGALVCGGGVAAAKGGLLRTRLPQVKSRPLKTEVVDAVVEDVLCKTERTMMTCKRTKPATEYEFLVIGMTRKIEEVGDVLLSQIVELNCKHGFMVEVLAGSLEGAERFCAETHAGCAPIRVITQPPIMTDPKGPYAAHEKRVARIAFARSTLRDDVRARFQHPLTAIVSVDMDLARMPSVEHVVRNAKGMKEVQHPDMVASLGLDYLAAGGEYYDTFATVLEDGTFSYPRPWWLLKQDRVTHDASVAVSHLIFGAFAQWDMTRYVQYKAKQQGGTMQVQSGFGGTAVYRAGMYLVEDCSHDLPYQLTDELRGKNENNLFLYADNYLARPCEHVIFNFCLREKFGAKIVIDPEMQTHWRWDVGPRMRDTLVNVGHWEWPQFENTLATFKPHFPNSGLSAEPVLTLQRNEWEVRVSTTGLLMVTNTVRGEVHWTPPEDEYVAKVADNWYRLLAVLGPMGELMVIQQREDAWGSVGCKPYEDGVEAPNCREVLWQTHGIGRGHYALQLMGNGDLEIREQIGQFFVTFWSSAWDKHDPDSKYHTVYMKKTECYRQRCWENGR